MVDYAFDVPLWKVLVTLFLVAIVLTAFKYYERHNIAPHHEIQWVDFDLAVVRQEQKRRRNLLIKVNSGQDEFVGLFDEPQVRAVVYLDKPVCLQIDSELAESEAVAGWLRENAPGLVDGGVCFTRSDGSPFHIARWNELTVELIQSWIDP